MGKIKFKFKYIKRYLAFIADLRQYRQMPGAETISQEDIYPCLDERTATTSFDTHYFYQDNWAFRKILDSGVKTHVDVGSNVYYVGFLTAITHVTFIDIRPLVTDLSNFEGRAGSILEMPYDDGSVSSLSCLHVVEHIGLGRYGDPLDPLGSIKACKELQRVLAPGGDLYFGLPIGEPRVCFNAHRIHSPGQIMDYFSSLKLAEFSYVNDNGHFIQNAAPEQANNEKYGCGLFHFKK